MTWSSLSMYRLRAGLSEENISVILYVSIDLHQIRSACLLIGIRVRGTLTISPLQLTICLLYHKHKGFSMQKRVYSPMNFVKRKEITVKSLRL